MSTTAPLGSCLVCGQPAVDFHHLSGRNLDRTRLDVDLGAPACHDCHENAHEALRAAGIDTAPDTATSLLGTVEHCLRRAASFLGQLCDQFTNPFWQTLATTVQEWAEMLGNQRQVLDLHHPGWHLLSNEGTRT